MTTKSIIANNWKLLAMIFGGFALFAVGTLAGGYVVHSDYENNLIAQYKVFSLRLIQEKKDLLEKNAELRHEVLTLLDLSEKQDAQLKKYRDAALNEGQAE